MSFYDSIFGGSLGDDAVPATNPKNPAQTPTATPHNANAPPQGASVASAPTPVTTSKKKPVIPAAWNRSIAPPPPQPARKPPGQPAPTSLAAQSNVTAAPAPPTAANTTPSAAPNNPSNRKATTNPGQSSTVATKKRGGQNASSDPYAVWDTAYDPNFPTDYAVYLEWRNHLRKLRPPPSPTGPLRRDSAHKPDPDSMDVDRVPPIVEESESSTSEASDSDSSHHDSDGQEDLDGEPMGELDLKQFPAFLRMYLDSSADAAALAQRLAVTIPTKHLAPDLPPPVRKSRVVVFENMIDAADVDDELEGETTEECSKFGKVFKCFVRVLQDPPEPSVRIFVRFAKYDGARAAVAAMNGRYYGGREVRASLYDEVWFDLGKYDAIIAAPSIQEPSERGGVQSWSGRR